MLTTVRPAQLPHNMIQWFWALSFSPAGVRDPDA